MGRIIFAGRHGDQTIKWDPRADTDEGRAAVRRAEEISVSRTLLKLRVGQQASFNSGSGWFLHFCLLAW